MLIFCVPVCRQSHEKNGHIPNGTIANGVHNAHSTKSHHRKSVDKCKDHGDQHDHKHTVDRHIDRQRVSHSHSNGAAVGAGAEDVPPQEPEPRPTTRRREKREQDKEREAAEYLQRLETDAKKLRVDLQSSRASEQELRLQVSLDSCKNKQLYKGRFWKIWFDRWYFLQLLVWVIKVSIFKCGLLLQIFQ